MPPNQEEKRCEKCNCDGGRLWKGNAKEMRLADGCTCECHRPTPIRENWGERTDIEGLTKAIGEGAPDQSMFSPIREESEEPNRCCENGNFGDRHECKKSPGEEGTTKLVETGSKLVDREESWGADDHYRLEELIRRCPNEYGGDLGEIMVLLKTRGAHDRQTLLADLEREAETTFKSELSAIEGQLAMTRPGAPYELSVNGYKEALSWALDTLLALINKYRV